MFQKQALIVDDEPLMQRCLYESFKRYGFQVSLAGNGEEALELFKKNPTGLVISDIKMPCMDGMELLKHIKTISPSTYVIMITAYGSIEKAVEALKIGAYDYIEKPFLKEKLDHIVTSIINLNNNDISQISQASVINTLSKVFENRSAVFPSKNDFNSQEIITCSPKMFQLMEIGKAVAKTKATVLLQGESGTGKELMANFIHRSSARSKAPFVAINCAALPENLLESELFGHEKGSFTGAMNRRRGIFERADKGTLFLDEIGEISQSLQAKLLRIIQEHKFERIGGETSINVDVRIITSTNRNLFLEVKNKNFREDLYYRLNVVCLNLIALRDRKEDIPVLINHFINKVNDMYEFKVEGISKDALTKLMQYPWPGNIRELENSIERAVIIKRKGILQLNDFSHFSDEGSAIYSKENINDDEKSDKEVDLCCNPISVDDLQKEHSRDTINQLDLPGFNKNVYDLQREHIVDTLKEFKGNRTQTAKALGLSVRTIRNRIREYRTLGIEV